MRLPEILTAVLLAPALLLAAPAGAEAPDPTSDSCAEAAVPGEGAPSGDLRYDLQTGGEAHFYVWLFLLFPDAASGGSSSVTVFVIPSNCASRALAVGGELVAVGIPADSETLEAALGEGRAILEAFVAGVLPVRTS